MGHREQDEDRLSTFSSGIYSGFLWKWYEQKEWERNEILVSSRHKNYKTHTKMILNFEYRVKAELHVRCADFHTMISIHVFKFNSKNMKIGITKLAQRFLGNAIKTHNGLKQDSKGQQSEIRACGEAWSLPLPRQSLVASRLPVRQNTQLGLGLHTAFSSASMLCESSYKDPSLCIRAHLKTRWWHPQTEIHMHSLYF